MWKRMPYLLFTLLGLNIMLFDGERISWGSLTDPGLNEREIRQRWRQFDAIKDRAHVRGNYPYMTCFKEAARRYDIPLPLLVAVARGESDFDPYAKSDKNCLGIMQIQWPGTARELGILRKSDLFNPCINIQAGARYLAWLLRRYGGDPYLAVAAYNYGPNAVSPQKVPEGAMWYAAYIHRHLKSVLSRPYEEAGKMLILRFTFYQRAAEFVAYLKKQTKGLPVEVFKSEMYTYDVYFMYRNTKEKKEYLQSLMERTGIKPLKGGHL